MRIKKSKSILLILLAIITILLVSFVINLTVRNDGIISEKITSTIGRLEEEKVKMSVKIKERLGNAKVHVLVKIESQEEIESIVFPNEDGTSITMIPQSERKTLAKDLKVELMKEYNVTINTKDGTSVTKTILLEGDGTKEHPYVIKTKEELQAVNEDLGAYYILGADIDLTGFEFTPIGSETPFTGNIDGTGYTIRNLTIENEESDNIGLFSNNNGTISNITLENIRVKGKSNVGGLVGYNTGTVTNCTVSGSVTGTGNNTGGLIGQIITGISGNTSKANVNGKNNTGGLVGYVYAPSRTITLNNNKAEGKVIGENQVGGLIGYLIETSSGGPYYTYVQKSYATGDVEGNTNVGGLIGQQTSNISRNGSTISINCSLATYVQECYAEGNVTATGNNAGGLIGYMYAYDAQTGGVHPIHQYAYTVVQNSFATGKVEGSTNIGALVGYANRTAGGQGSPNSYIQITNTYAIGEVIGTGELAKTGGLVGNATSSGSGSTTVTNSYWTPETTKQENSVLGTKNIIPYMMRKIGYDNWDFESIWQIDELNTIAYLKNIQKPESVNKENIEYEEFDVIGEGTSESPFIITHPVQLQKITDRLSSYYKLGANIDLTGRIWTPIGTEAAPFTGNIDGTGYTISNLNYDNEEGQNVGLFGYSKGTISNITLENGVVKGKTNVGGLVGYNTGTVTQCILKGNITGLGDNVGGLIGYNAGTVTNNKTEGIVTGTGSNTGGLIGQTITGISGNTSKANVNGKNNTGGLVGYVYAPSRTITLNNNKAEGKVIGENQVGGLIGYLIETSSGGPYYTYVQKSYATGDVEGNANVGGLIGQQTSYISRKGSTININCSLATYVQECYAEGNVTATGNNAGGLIGYMYAYDAQTGGVHPIHQYAYTVVQNSFATGKVEGSTNIGALVGYANRTAGGQGSPNSYIQITNTYAIGEVTGTGKSAKTGGLVGTASSSGNGSTTVTNSYWNTETTKQETSALGTASNTEGMTGTELYTNWSTDIWTIEQGQYPKLKF